MSVEILCTDQDRIIIEHSRPWMRVFVRVILFNDDDCHNVILMFLGKKRPKCPTVFVLYRDAFGFKIVSCLLFGMFWDLFIQSAFTDCLLCVKTYDSLPCSTFIGFEKVFKHLIRFRHSSGI